MWKDSVIFKILRYSILLQIKQIVEKVTELIFVIVRETLEC